jgi:ComF family protein
LPYIEQACPVCAVELVTTATEPCGACQRRRPPFESSFCAFRYAYPVNHLIRNLKYHGAIHWGRTLGLLLASRLPRHEPRPTLLVPVPLSTARFRARGFNQADEIAAVVARRLQLPLCTDLLRRVRDTAEQAGLDGKERRKNVRHAFAVTRPLLRARIALIDDVITTGSTVREIARVLRRAGAEHISVWAVARVTK